LWEISCKANMFEESEGDEVYRLWAYVQLHWITSVCGLKACFYGENNSVSVDSETLMNLYCATILLVLCWDVNRGQFKHLQTAYLFNRCLCNHTGMAWSQILILRGPETYICPTFGLFFDS
jgi:hypothetical protein